MFLLMIQTISSVVRKLKKLFFHSWEFPILIGLAMLYLFSSQTVLSGAFSVLELEPLFFSYRIKTGHRVAVQQNNYSWVIVKKSFANIRKIPSMEGDVICHCPFGVALKVTSCSGQWFRVRLGSGKEGWIHKNVVSAAGKLWVNVVSVPALIRPSPNPHAFPVDNLPRGMKVIVAGRKGKWLRIFYRKTGASLHVGYIYFMDVDTHHG
jgi:hypothetical protein